MAELLPRPRRSGLFCLLIPSVVTVVVAVSCPPGRAQDKKIDLLKIGSSGTFMSETGDRKKEEAALQTLREFMKEETMMDNEIVKEKDWAELAQKMSKGELHLGVFHGYEFAWAQEKHAELKPLALAVNVYRYPVAYVVTNKNKGPKDIAALQGQTLVIPATGGERFLLMFVNHLITKAGKSPDKFFGKVTTHDNIEDALDDVVDGVVQAAAVDKAALEAFKRRKPGRFNQLHELAHSEPLPPVVIAYYGKVLSDATLKTFRDGVLGASKKDKGQTILTLFRLTGFETVPDDFGKVLAETRKTYPPNTAVKSLEVKGK
jgi:ABC-type phosphate/phosphonate transport system substrate-binding protein